MKVIHKCTSVRHAVSAEKLGVDVISINGYECAGHPDEDDIGLIVLLPATVDAVKVPVIASGGMAGGRSLAAALTLAADGVNMGTRFVCTLEAGVHENVKRKIIENTERDTMLINRTLRNTARVAKNAISQEVAEIQRDSSFGIEAVRELVSGARGRAQVLQDGDLNGGFWTAGQSQGLSDDIPTCKDMVQVIMRQAQDVLLRCAGAVERARPRLFEDAPTEFRRNRLKGRVGAIGVPAGVDARPSPSKASEPGGGPPMP